MPSTIDSGLQLEGRRTTSTLNDVNNDTGRIAWTLMGILPRRHGHDGQSPASWRRGVVTECRMSRMVRTARHKYVVYSHGERREQLIDMEEDPGEMQNLAVDPAYARVLAAHRMYLVHWYEAHGEKLDPKYVVQ